MIEPERILRYFECVSLLIIDSQNSDGTWDWTDALKNNCEILLEELYLFSHIGTVSLHDCQHPDWEQQFLEAEQALIEHNHLKPWNDGGK